jgi:hypothetical protein
MHDEHDIEAILSDIGWCNLSNTYLPDANNTVIYNLGAQNNTS